MHDGHRVHRTVKFLRFIIIRNKIRRTKSKHRGANLTSEKKHMENGNNVRGVKQNMIVLLLLLPM